MTAAQQTPLPLMTGEEFLAWDGGGLPGKLELVNGRVRAMSPASASYRDADESMLACSTISTVREIVLIECERTEVTLYRKDAAGVWQSLEDAIVLKSGDLHLASIEVTIPLADIYAGIPPSEGGT